MASYSRFTDKQASVLANFIKVKVKDEPFGGIEVKTRAIVMMYDRARAFINHDVAYDEIETHLCNAVSYYFNGDYEDALYEINEAIRTHDVHFTPAIRPVVD